MGEKQQIERMNWLSATLAAQRDNLVDILARLRGVAFKVGDSLSLHKKFVRFLDQVAVEREKELDIIHEIEAVEEHHRALKKLRQLRRANASLDEKRQNASKKKDVLEDECGEKEPERLSWAEILLLYWFFFSRSDSFSFFNFFSKKAPLAVDPAPQPKASGRTPEVE